jgi:hypothetical protein
MEERTAISKEEAEFEKLLATALECERQKLREEEAAQDSQTCASSESPE